MRPVRHRDELIVGHPFLLDTNERKVTFTKQRNENGCSNNDDADTHQNHHVTQETSKTIGRLVFVYWRFIVLRFEEPQYRPFAHPPPKYRHDGCCDRIGLVDLESINV